MLNKIIKPFLDVRPEERAKTFLMFFYFFLTISLIYILKPVQKSLFVAEFGAEKLPFANMAEGLFLVVVVNFYMQFAKRVSRAQFSSRILIFFLSNLIVFWGLFKINLPYLSGFFYIWQASFSITMTTVFWTLANDLFDKDEAQRLFGLIISGGSFGGIFGGLLTHQAMRWIKTEELLLLAASVLSICLILVTVIWKKIPSTKTGERLKKDDSHVDDKKSVFKIFAGSQYYLLLAAIVVLPKIASTIIDNQFTAVAEGAFGGNKDEMTAFFGWFFALLNGVSLFMQLCLTSVALRFLGIGLSLLVLPLGLSVFSLGAALFPSLWLAVIYRIYDGSVNYSIQQATKEMLYLPIPSRIRNRIKPVIDMLGFRGAKLLAGLYMAAAIHLGLAAQSFGLLVLALIPLWVLAAWKMKHRNSVNPG